MGRPEPRSRISLSAPALSGAFTLAKQQKLERLLEATPQKTFRGRVLPQLSCHKKKHSGRGNLVLVPQSFTGGRQNPQWNGRIGRDQVVAGKIVSKEASSNATKSVEF